MRSTVRRVEEEFGGRIEEKSRGALWQKGTTRSKAIRVRMVHKGSNSNICVV